MSQNGYGHGSLNRATVSAHRFAYELTKGPIPDAIGWTWFHSVPVEHYPADWGANGKAAGPIRNKQMLVEGRPDLVIAFPGGRGTANMIEQAERAGVPVRRVT